MLYLIGGENLYSSTQRLEELKSEFQERFGGTIKVINADEVTDYNEILKDVDSFSLFSQPRLIVLKRVFSAKSSLTEKIFEYIKVGKDLNLVLWEDKSFDKRTRLYKLIKRKGIVEEFSNLNLPQLKTWLSKYLKEKIQYESECIDALIIKVGNNQSQLISVADNLTTLLKAENRRKLTMEDINRLVEKTAEENIWEFIDAVGECDKDRALGIMERLLREKSDFVIIVAMIARQLRIIATVKSLQKLNRNHAAIASTLRLHPFVVRKAVGHSRNFSTNQLRKLYQKLVRTDLVVKQGKFEEKLALNLLIAAL